MARTASSLAQLTMQAEQSNIANEGREPTCWDAAPPMTSLDPRLRHLWLWGAEGQPLRSGRWPSIVFGDDRQCKVLSADELTLHNLPVGVIVIAGHMATDRRDH